MNDTKAQAATHHGQGTGQVVVTVYGQPGCGPCKATARSLTKRGIAYSYVDVTVYPEAHAHITSLGFKATPVVEVKEVGGDGQSVVWAELRMDAINDLARVHAGDVPFTALAPHDMQRV